MTDEQFIATAGGGILYDASRLSKPDAQLFSRSHWASLDALEEIVAPCSRGGYVGRRGGGGIRPGWVSRRLGFEIEG